LSNDFIKFVDEYVGRLLSRPLAWLLKMFSRQPAARVEKILVIKFWGIGSVTLATPLLVRLRQQYPAAKIFFLTLESNRELCALISEIDDIITVSLASLPRFVRTYFSTLHAIYKERFDWVLDLEFFAYAAAIAGACSAAPVRMGFVNQKRKNDLRALLYTQRTEFSETAHSARNFLNLLDPAAEIKFPSFKKSGSFFEVPNHTFPIVLNINASPLAYERRWDPDNFAKLADFLIAHFNGHIFLIGTPSEKPYVDSTFEKITRKDGISNLCGKLRIADLISLIRQSRLVITNDSGPLHLASALNVPTVCFFGPETPLRFGSLSTRHLTFYKNLWCSPCMTISNLKAVNCINNLECMKQISLKEVEKGISTFINDLHSMEAGTSEKEL
jgi:ADP-heptose:LPS heptosyltransferase